ncbi:YiiD C-terminal domain-containing protein [Bacteriovorax sp. Seq25_V]|uniref:YiiD C-terminal domain-containing protein n=1 Tax=Bacteriovorax sp. Seq25_V TaxID=1201288 RepID=UPI00038A22D1|nr:YiiD C-terminal domain-containing protein [Bacteriovorax sp. Seq25_V]EQC47164.1 putative thioesterase [Bacteriovorax sp. Seq25_V]
MQKLLKKFPTLINLYPPFIGAGIKVHLPTGDYTNFHVSMKLKITNQNYVGTQFGGSLYSMCDPFFMLIAMNKLGREYLVWDKSATIDFISPGKGQVHAHFQIPDNEIQEIIKRVEANGKDEPVFEVNIIDNTNTIIAKVSKKLWIRKKKK